MCFRFYDINWTIGVNNVNYKSPHFLVLSCVQILSKFVQTCLKFFTLTIGKNIAHEVALFGSEDVSILQRKMQIQILSPLRKVVLTPKGTYVLVKGFNISQLNITPI
jgi:hypothetical protein